MKKSGILFIVLLLLSSGGYFLVINDRKEENGNLTSDRGFNVKSMDDVQKIVIKHVKLQPLVFTRQGKQWLLNGKYSVDDAVFINVEKVLTGMKMLYIPSKATTSTILESIKKNGIQLDVYEGGNQPSRIISIGTDTQKGDGTFMILGGTDQPYVMHLPGLAGGLRSRFEQPLENFRDKYLFKDQINHIDYIKVEYPKQNSSSFIIENKAEKATIRPLIENITEPALSANHQLITAYLSGFESLGAEKLINQYPAKDSVIAKIPNCIIELKRRDGIIKHFKFFDYDDIETVTGNSRSPEEIRGQNHLLVYTNEKDFYTVQNRVFGDIFRGYQEFFKPENNQKISK